MRSGVRSPSAPRAQSQPTRVGFLRFVGRARSEQTLAAARLTLCRSLHEVHPREAGSAEGPSKRSGEREGSARGGRGPRGDGRGWAHPRPSQRTRESRGRVEHGRLRTKNIRGRVRHRRPTALCSHGVRRYRRVTIVDSRCILTSAREMRETRAPSVPPRSAVFGSHRDYDEALHAPSLFA